MSQQRIAGARIDWRTFALVDGSFIDPPNNSPTYPAPSALALGPIG